MKISLPQLLSACLALCIVGMAGTSSAQSTSPATLSGSYSTSASGDCGGGYYCAATAQGAADAWLVGTEPTCTGCAESPVGDPWTLSSQLNGQTMIVCLPFQTFDPAGNGGAGGYFSGPGVCTGGVCPAGAVISLTAGVTSPTANPMVCTAQNPADCVSVQGQLSEWRDDVGPLTAGSWTQSDANYDAKQKMGGHMCLRPSSATQTTCDAVVTSVSCQPTTGGDGALYASCNGSAMFSLTGAACQAGAWSASSPGYLTRSSGDTGSGNKTGVSGGGQGVVGASGAGAADQNAENLARIASNTKQIADSLNSANTANGGASVNGTGTGSGGSTCGGTDPVTGQPQPACAVTVNEGNTGSSQTSMQTGISGQQSAMGTSMDTRAAQFDGTNTPSMTPGAGHWLPSFRSFLPGAACSFDLNWHFPVPGHDTTFTTTLSVCTWGEYVRDILGMISYVLTVLFVFWTLFRRSS